MAVAIPVVHRKEGKTLRWSAVALTLLSLAGCPPTSCGCSPIPPFLPYLPQSVVIADFNTDGAADLAVGTYRYYPTDPTAGGFVAVVLQNRNVPGTFQSGTDIYTSVNPSALAVGDLNGNGGPDLVVAGVESTNVALLFQTSSGSNPFAPVVTAPTDRPSGFSNSTDVAVGDLNGDGATDIAVADDRVSGELVVLLQNAALMGTFSAPRKFAVGNRAISAAIGDLNGDGRPDLAVVSQDSANHVARASIFFRDPGAVDLFAPRADLAIGENAKSLRIADLDGDGLQDMIVTKGLPSTLAVYRQNPAQRGSFLAPSTFALPDFPERLVIGDLNGDSKLDLVVQSVLSISVLLQDAATSGSFLNAVRYTGFFYAKSIAVGDLNGDALPDIAVAAGNRANILFNIASAPGTFANPVEVGT